MFFYEHEYVRLYICMSECQFLFNMQISLEARPHPILIFFLSPTLLYLFTSRSLFMKNISTYSIGIWQHREKSRNNQNKKVCFHSIFLSLSLSLSILLMAKRIENWAFRMHINWLKIGLLRCVCVRECILFTYAWGWCGLSSIYLLLQIKWLKYSTYNHILKWCSHSFFWPMRPTLISYNIWIRYIRHFWSIHLALSLYFELEMQKF